MLRKLALISLALFAAVAGYAQNVSDLIIAEVLAEPDSTGIVDDYGRRSGWIEIYNTSMGTVKYGGCYLTDEFSQPRKSPIPKSDLATQLGPRQSRVFYASGRTHDGSFYTDFTLAPGKTVYLVSNDGRTVIDSLAIPADLPAGQSVAKVAVDAKGLVFERVWPCAPTPGAYNGDPTLASRSDQMAERDPHGWILTIVSVSVVFSALAILWFFFWLLFDKQARKAAKSAADMRKKFGFSESPSKNKTPKAGSDAEVAAAIALALDQELNGDTYAAIATAVHLYLSERVHDIETGIITIRRSEGSAWNAKGLNFRKLPR